MSFHAADHLNVALKKYNLEPVYGVTPGKRFVEDDNTNPAADDYVDLGECFFFDFYRLF